MYYNIVSQTVLSHHASKATEGPVPIDVSLQISLCDRWGHSVEGVLKVGPADGRYIPGLHTQQIP